MATRRSSYHHGDLANALLDASERLVEKNGVTGFSMREAARAVGVDPAAAYRHFENREMLLDAVAKRGFEALGHTMIAVSSQKKDVPAKVRAMAGAYIDFALEHSAKFRVMFGARGVDVREPIPNQPSAYGLLSEVLEGWLPSGRGTDAHAVMFWSGVHGLACLLIEGALQLSPRERQKQISLFIDVMLAGVDTAR